MNMKTESLKTFFGTLGITSTMVDEQKGLIELPYLNGLVVAVSGDIGKQQDATERFRDVSHTNKTMVVSALPLHQAEATTIVPGVDIRVPVFSVFAGRFEDTYPTNGHQITNNRILTIMRELESIKGNKRSSKTPYLSWLSKAMGITKPHSLEALQDIIIEASRIPEASAVPAIRQLAVGRGTRYAVMTVNPKVEYHDTQPVVSESDWIMCDLERLVMGGMTDAQAAVLRKTSEAYYQAIKTVTVKPVKDKPAVNQTLQMLGA